MTDGGGVWRDGEAPADTAWVTDDGRIDRVAARDRLRRLVRDEIPAHVRAELYVGPRRIWSSDVEE